MDREEGMLKEAFSLKHSYMKVFLLVGKNFERIPKDAVASQEFRKQGNALFTQKTHDNQTHLQVLHNYCRAIVTAPNDSEDLALGYGNRSAFLLHLEKYEDCIKDVDMALEITKSATLRAKLLCRKAACLRNLGSMEAEAVSQEADECIAKLKDKNKDKYSILMQKIRDTPVNSNRYPPEIETLVSESKDAPERVTINHSEGFGRHLLAARDYAPGDIIFVEKTYVAHINARMIFTNCDYCLKLAWSGIPCSNCSWTIYCSKECRAKAAELYHDVECSLIPFLNTTIPESLLNKSRLTLRAAIIAIREAGDVTELMNRLKTVDSCTDMSLKGFYSNGQFKSGTIESMYSLCSSYHEPDFMFDGQATTVLVILIGLCTQTKLLKSRALKKIDNLVKSKKLLFLGSLMIKLNCIRRNNNDALYGKYRTCEQGDLLSECWATSCCTRGYFMAPLISLINHSCFPNAGRCFTNSKQVILYAIHPIKKGTQISMAYYQNFYDVPKSERQVGLEVRNIFDCFCQACRENWLPILKLPKEVLDKYKLGIRTQLEKKLYDDCLTILAAFHKDTMINNKFIYFKMEHLEMLSKAITEAFCHLKQPSFLTSELVSSLSEVFPYIYGLKPRHMGKCSRYRYSEQDFA